MVAHQQILVGGFTSAIITTSRSRAAQETEFDLQALAFAPQLADQRHRPPADPEVPAIMLDAAHFMERIFVERRFALHPGTMRAEQAAPAIIPEHFGMHAGKVSRGIEL